VRQSSAKRFLNSVGALMVCLCFSAFASDQSQRTDRQLGQQLQQIEPMVWKDPWAARETLHTILPQVAAADGNLQALYYLRLAHSLQYLYLKQEFADAVAAGLAAVTSETALDTRLFLNILDGVRARFDGDYVHAQDLMAQAAADASANGLDFLYVFSLAELAFTRSVAGDNELALIELQEAFASAVAQQNQFLIALVNESFGAVYGYIDEYQQSLDHYQKALDSYAELGYAVYEAEATYGIAISYRYNQQWDNALATFQRYRDMTEHNESDHGTFMADYGLGMTYAEKGDCPSALDPIARALATTAPLDFKAELYKRQAVCLARAGDAAGADEAIDSARDVFDQMEEFKGTRWEVDVLKAESQVAAAFGDHSRAYQLLLTFHEQIAALLRKNASERLMTLRVEMEDARKDHEIALLKEEARVDAVKLEQQQHENDMQRVTTATWIGSTFIAIVFFGLQLRNTRRFRDLSSRDGLTGLYNRRFIFSHLEKLSADLPLDKGNLSIILIDVDNFKQINDQYGHPAGDSILEVLADIGSGLLRHGDEMARVGGEEFLCVLPRTSTEEAARVAQRLLERIREHPFRLPDGSKLQVTISIGVASFGVDSRNADSLYAAADDAMYRAKSNGKDQLVAAS